MENRAAVFTSQPQAVEVYQAGTWWSGELLGWRHDSNGGCQVWVRVVLAGVEETAWTDLSTLRLPERHLTVATEFASAPTPSKAARVVESSRRHARADDLGSTASLPMVRDLSAATPAVRTGGRRRAPEDADVQVVTATSVPVPAGRHRAPAAGPVPPPADAGRHRAADTGLFPVVSGDATAERRAVPRSSGAPDAWSVPPARAARPEETRSGRSRAGRTLPSDAEPDVMTRTMRLSDHAPHSRRPRLDSSLRIV
jgi:hypothetical protein